MNNVNLENNHRQVILPNEGSRKCCSITGAISFVADGILKTTTFVYETGSQILFRGNDLYTRIMVDRLNKNLDSWCNQVANTKEYESRQKAKKIIIKSYKENSCYLSLDNLGLTSLPDEIGWLHSVTAMYLQGNELQQLPATMAQLKSLSALKLVKNCFQEFPVVIGQLTHLRFLDLNENKIKTLPKEIKNLQNLKEFCIDENQLQKLPEEIGDLRELEFFIVRKNQLQELPASIGRLQKLENFCVDHNKLQGLPIEIGELRNLECLSLENNQINSLANLVENYPEQSLFNPYTEVELDGNPILDDRMAYRSFLALLNRRQVSPEILEFESIEDRDPLTISFEDFSRHPTQVLLHLFEAMTENGLPQIEYIDSPGVDAGGVTRDCVTRVFFALFGSEACALPMKSKTAKEQYIPLIVPETKLSLKEQILCYQAIGKIFTLALIGYKSINTGPYFEPIVFSLIHSLSEEELSTFPRDLDVLNMKELPRGIFEKLFSIYAEKALKMKSETISHILAGQFEDDEDLQVACLSSMEDVYACSQIDKIIPAILTIALSMYDYRKELDQEGQRNLDSWNQLKEVSGNALMQRIEGRLRKADLLAVLEWRLREKVSTSRLESIFDLFQKWVLRRAATHERTKKFFEEWIQKAPDVKLRKFLWALTSNPTLIQNRKLLITFDKKNTALPEFHSCFGKLDFSDREYANYAAFKEDFEFSIEESLAQGFSLA